MSPRRLYRAALLALLVPTAALAPAAHAQRMAERVGDLRQATAVRLALVADAATRPLDVAVTARSGVATLSGNVPSPLAADCAEAVARGVDGVSGVVNRLAVAGLTAPAPLEEERDAAPQPGASQSGAPPQERERPPSEGGRATYHTVQLGDTLFNLARRYGTTVEALRQMNGLNDEAALALGQRLRIR